MMRLKTGVCGLAAVTILLAIPAAAQPLVRDYTVSNAPGVITPPVQSQLRPIPGPVEQGLQRLPGPVEQGLRHPPGPLTQGVYRVQEAVTAPIGVRADDRLAPRVQHRLPGDDRRDRYPRRDIRHREYVRGHDSRGQDRVRVRVDDRFRVSVDNSRKQGTRIYNRQQININTRADRTRHTGTHDWQDAKITGHGKKNSGKS